MVSSATTVTTLEEAEDALARATHEVLDLVLGGPVPKLSRQFYYYAL
jgi:hypothetical protein